MQINHKEELKNFSFSDFNVTSVEIFKKTKTLIIRLDGAVAKIDGKLIKLIDGYLEVKKYRYIEISSYDAPIDNEETLSEDKYEMLRELCEIETREDVLIIKGFAVDTFHWLEFKITGGQFYGEFKEKI